MSGPNARIMNYVVIALGATVWAAGISGSQIANGAPSFVFEVMENDDLWKEKLWVNVKVDTAMVPVAARNVLEELGAIGDRSTDQPAAASDGSQPAAEGGRASVVTVNALRVTTKVVSSHHEEGESIEFAMSVIASAVKCNALQYVSVQLRAVDSAMTAADVDREAVDQRISDVWTTLVSYLDKLSRLKEPLGVESEMYRKWETVAVKWFGSEAAVTTAAAELLQEIRKLVDDSLSRMCELSTYEQYEPRLGFAPETEHWDSPDGVAAIFNKCQGALNAMLGAIPISTMDVELWNEFLDKSDKLNKLLRGQMGEREITITE